MKFVTIHFDASIKEGVTRKAGIVSTSISQNQYEELVDLSQHASSSSGWYGGLFRRTVQVDGCRILLLDTQRVMDLSDWGPGICRADRRGNMQIAWLAPDLSVETTTFTAAGLSFEWNQAALVAVSNVVASTAQPVSFAFPPTKIL